MTLTKLSAEQEAMIPVVRDEWLGHGLSTEPADRARAVAGWYHPSGKRFFSSASGSENRCGGCGRGRERGIGLSTSHAPSYITSRTRRNPTFLKYESPEASSTRRV